MHVLNGERPVEIDTPTGKSVGGICCGLDESVHDVDSLRLICEAHLIEMGILKQLNPV